MKLLSITILITLAISSASGFFLKKKLIASLLGVDGGGRSGGGLNNELDALWNWKMGLLQGKFGQFSSGGVSGGIIPVNQNPIILSSPPRQPSYDVGYQTGGFQSGGFQASTGGFQTGRPVFTPVPVTVITVLGNGRPEQSLVPAGVPDTTGVSYDWSGSFGGQGVGGVTYGPPPKPLADVIPISVAPPKPVYNVISSDVSSGSYGGVYGNGFSGNNYYHNQNSGIGSGYTLLSGADLGGGYGANYAGNYVGGQVLDTRPCWLMDSKNVK